MMSSPPTLPPGHPRDVMKQSAWVPNDIWLLQYFHPHINSSNGAIILMKNNPRAGSFILRLSSKGAGNLTLSVNIGNQRVHHVNVLINNGVYYIVPELKFTSFEQLQKYYSEHRIGNKEKVDNVKLLYPINRKSDSFLLNKDVRDNRDSTGSDIRNSSGSNSDDQNDRINSRPPMPTPDLDLKPACGVYTYARTTVDRSEELKDLLRSTEKCDCGLLMADADLGNGWAVHKSRDTTNFGKLFYQNQYNTTSWFLPETVLIQLSQEKWNFLKKLHEENKQKFPYDDVKMKRLRDAMLY